MTLSRLCPSSSATIRRAAWSISRVTAAPPRTGESDPVSSRGLQATPSTRRWRRQACRRRRDLSSYHPVSSAAHCCQSAGRFRSPWRAPRHNLSVYVLSRMLFPAIPGSRSWRADGVAPCPSRRTVCGGDHWEAPDALWPANGQNQEGARRLREAAVKRPHTRAAYAWAHIGSPGTAMGGARSLDGSCVYRPAPRPRGGSQPYSRALDGFGLRRCARRQRR